MLLILSPPCPITLPAFSGGHMTYSVTAAGSAPIGPEGGPRIGGPGGTPCGAPCPPPYGPEGAPYGAGAAFGGGGGAPPPRGGSPYADGPVPNIPPPGPGGGGTTCVAALLAARLARGSAPEMTRVCPPPAPPAAAAAAGTAGTAAATLPLAPPPPLCPIASFTCRNRFARSAAVCCAGCPPLAGPRGAFPYGCARPPRPSASPRAGPPLRPYPPGGIDRGSTGGLRERQKQKRARVRRIVSLRALVVVVVERDRSIEIDRHRISAIFRASRARLRSRASLVRPNKGTRARASVVARVARRRSRRARVPSRHDAR